MLRHKRNLTQSEKHKEYTEGGGQSLNNFSLKKSSSIGLQFLECPQNLIESRKCAVVCEEIEKAKSKSLARINGEKHLLKLKYKGLIKDDEDDDITRTFFLQPGFRFHSNGDIRKLRDPRVLTDNDPVKKRSALSLVKSNLSHQSLSSKTSSINLKKTNSHVSTNSWKGNGDGLKKPEQVKVNIDKAIKEIERDLASMKSDKDLIDINRKIHDVRHSLTFVRAHSNDYKPDVRYISVNTDDQEQFLRKLRDHGVSEKCSINDKLSRRCTRLNCVACEFRLKCGNQKEQMHLESPDKHLKRWETAPRGSYVGHLEQNESKIMSVNQTKSALIPTKSRRFAKSAKSITNDTTSLIDNISKRSSKSASSSEHKKILARRASAKRIKKIEKAYGLVDKFKDRESIFDTEKPQHTASEKTLKEDSDDNIDQVKCKSSPVCMDADSERIIQVQNINSLHFEDTSFDEGDPGDVCINSKEDLNKQKTKTDLGEDLGESESLIHVLCKAVVRYRCILIILIFLRFFIL